MGNVNRACASMMDIFCSAIDKRVDKIILVYNHPSGNHFPSEADFDITNRAIKSGYIIGIEILDHLVITKNAYWSFSEYHSIRMLRNHLKYVPLYILKEWGE